jgi:hypothetical protein
VIIHDFDIVRAVRPPFEANPPLAIDSDTVLPLSPTAQRFQAVAGQPAEGSKGVGGVEQAEPLFRLSCETLELAYPLTIEKLLGAAIPKAPDHANA